MQKKKHLIFFVLFTLPLSLSACDTVRNGPVNNDASESHDYPATITLDVTPEGASWDVHNYDHYDDDDYYFYKSGQGDVTLTVPSNDFYDIYIYAKGYGLSYNYTDLLNPGDTVNLSISLEKTDGSSVSGGIE